MNQFNLSARTNKGMVRDHNEDNFIVSKDIASNNWTDISPGNFSGGDLGTLLVVADGMGGAEAGEIASEIAVRSIKDSFIKIKEVPSNDRGIRNQLSNAILNAHQNIVKDAEKNPERFGMGTTMVIAWILGNKVYIGWSGDSRAYAYRAATNSLELLTDDHSLVWDYVKKGQLTPEEARVHPDSNIINQSLGGKNDPPKPEVIISELQQDDILMLCSDGLNGMLSDPQMEMIFKVEKDMNTLTERLIHAANEAGGIDNITITAVKAAKLTKGAGKPSGIFSNPILMAIPLALIIIMAFAYVIWPKDAKSVIGVNTTNHTEIPNDEPSVDDPSTDNPTLPEQIEDPMDNSDPSPTNPKKEKKRKNTSKPLVSGPETPADVTVETPVNDSSKNEELERDTITEKVGENKPPKTKEEKPPPPKVEKDLPTPEEIAFEKRVNQLNSDAEKLYNEIQKVTKKIKGTVGVVGDQTEKEKIFEAKKLADKEIKPINGAIINLTIINETNKVQILDQLLKIEKINQTSERLKKIATDFKDFKTKHAVAINN